MRLTTVKVNNTEVAGIVHASRIMTIISLNQQQGFQYPADLLSLIQNDQVRLLRDWYQSEGKQWLDKHLDKMIPADQVEDAPLYRQPQKIFGIGLNYADHAQDLATPPPSVFPGSFFKPTTTIIGYAESIRIPPLSEKTTGEAELGVIIGRECSNINRENWLDYVAGFTTIIDVTAEDIVRQNPRFLTMAKSFDTFFSFGPELITPDEIEDVTQLRVATVLNGEVHAENTISNMRFPPDELVAFHSRVMRWMPGDILSTGTPRAVHIQHGDIVECRIDGFRPLKNSVVDSRIMEGGQ